MLVQQYFEEVLRLEGKSENTISEYARRLKLWQRFLQRQNQTLVSATRQNVLDYRQHLLKIKQSPRTINVKISTISIFYDHLVLAEKINHNPVPPGLYLKTTSPVTPRLSNDDIALFKTWINSLQPNLRAAFWCLYGSGARVGEVAHLKVSDVQLVNGAVYLDIKNAKWHSDRFVPIMDATAAKIVYQYKLDQSISQDSLFHVKKATLQTYATAFANATGIPFHCHILRHHFATTLVEKGVPITKVQHLLGHKNLSMTLHYVKNAKKDVTFIAPTITL